MKLNISRRQFLQYCTASAAALGLSQTDLLKLGKALATPQTGCGVSGQGVSVIWLSAQACSGCQVTLLNRVVDTAGSGYYDADMLNPLYGTGGLAPFGSANYTVSQGSAGDPLGAPLNVVNDVADLVVGDGVGTLVPQISRSLGWSAFPNGYITAEWFATVNAGAGDINVDHLNSVVTGPGPFVLLVDGSVPTTDEAYCMVFDDPNDYSGFRGVNTPAANPDSVTVSSALRWMAPNAAFILSIGTCSSFGGIPAGKRNKTGAISVADFVSGEGIGTTVVNIAGCPPHPDWIVYPVAYFIINAALPALDSKGRVAATYGEQPFCHNSVHGDCPNYVTQGTGDAAQFLGDDGCQGSMGCKGWKTFGDCPTRMKNVFDDGTKNNWCSAGSRGGNIGEARAVCQGCIEPDFPDAMSPFYESTIDDA